VGQYTEVTADHGELTLYTKGQWVTWAQELLHRWGWNLGPSGVDGLFGPWTKAAVIAFQNNAGMTGTGVVDTATWQALEAAKLVFDAWPTTNGNNLEWTIRNDGFVARPAGKSAGRFEVFERGGNNRVVGPEENVALPSDLAPAGTFTPSVDLLRMSPLDGEFTAEVRLKLDAAAVDYDVVNGAVAAAGAFKAQGPAQAPGNPQPRLMFHTQPARSGSKIVFDVRNAGAGDVYANDPVGDIEIWEGVTTVFTPPAIVAPSDIYSLDIRRIEVDLAGAALPDALLTAVVTLPGMVIGSVDFEFAAGTFSDP
jgi:hypothetical protein